MFEDLIDPNDLEWTEHRLRVEVMMLKKAEKAEELFRLYGVLAKILAKRSDHLKAQDALNDQEFLVVENKWRGTPLEIWGHYDRALVFAEFGRPEVALRNLEKAEELLSVNPNEEIEAAVATAKETVLRDD